LQTDR